MVQSCWSRSPELRNIISPPGDCTRPELGSISERFESNGNPEVLNNTNDSDASDKGGWSYGSYQIASEVGAMGDFMAFLERQANGFQDFQSALEKSTMVRRYGFDGKGFGFYEKWKDLASDPETVQLDLNNVNMTLYKDNTMTEQLQASRKNME